MSSTNAARSIATLSIERPVLTWIVILGCLLGGLHGFMNIGRLEDPAFTIKEAIIFVPYPGATAIEVEEEVTEQIETELQQMAEVDEIRSESSPGMAEIHVVIEDTFDGEELPEIWTKMRARIRDVAPSLPPGVGEPIIFDDFGETYGIFYAITAEGFSDERIRDVARMLRRELLVVEGVSRVAVEGEPQERIYIEVPQEELARVGLSYELLLQAIGSENAVVDAGATPVGNRYIRLDIPQTLSGVEAIENLLITPGEGPTPFACRRWRRSAGRRSSGPTISSITTMSVHSRWGLPGRRMPTSSMSAARSKRAWPSSKQIFRSDSNCIRSINSMWSLTARSMISWSALPCQSPS